jgi:hypothetical protein
MDVDDLIERLAHDHADRALCNEAATALTQLRDENARLREALRACRRAVSGGLDEPRRNVREIADEALGDG